MSRTIFLEHSLRFFPSNANARGDADHWVCRLYLDHCGRIKRADSRGKDGYNHSEGSHMADENKILDTVPRFKHKEDILQNAKADH